MRSAATVVPHIDTSRPRASAVSVRDLVAAFLILAILAVVLGLGVSGGLQILLALATGCLTVFLVRSRPRTHEDPPS